MLQGEHSAILLTFIKLPFVIKTFVLKFELYVLLHSFIYPLQIGYEAEELAKVGSKHMYTGSMSLDGVFLARAVCVNKKELKHLVFEKGLNVLMNKTVAEIYSLIDPGVQTLR